MSLRVQDVTGRHWRPLVACLLCAVALTAIGCGGDDAERSTGGSTELTLTLPNDPPTLDPHATVGGAAYQVGRQVFDTLIVRDEKTQEFLPSLATKWEVEDQGRRYVFTLKPDVTFQDGSPFDAEAVVFNLDRVVDPATKSVTAKDLIGPYASSRAIDEHTVEVRYKTTTSPTKVLDALSQTFFGMVSPTAVEKYGEDFGRHPVGTGPFAFKEWTANDHITLVRNDDYRWAPADAAHKDAAYLSSVTFRIMPEAPARTAALRSGDVGIARSLEPTDVAQFENNDARQLVRGSAPGFPVSIAMNTETGPLTDPKVRQAILYAFDRDTMLEEVFAGQYAAAFGPLSPTTWSYNPEVESMYGFDVARANVLLDEAGWRKGSDGIREKDGKKLELRFFDLFERRRGEYLQANLEAVGIKLVPRVVSTTDLFSITRKASGYEMASLWFISSDPSVLGQLFLSSNVEDGLALTRWRDKALDAQLQRGENTFDDEARKAIYEQVQTEIMDNALVIPFYPEPALDGIQSSYAGYRLERGVYPVLYDVKG
jgi:peptide/nickel transport system substrate-binding protein